MVVEIRDASRTGGGGQRDSRFPTALVLDHPSWKAR